MPLPEPLLIFEPQSAARYVPPGSHRFAQLIPKMLEWANRDGVHPVLQAAELHHNAAAIHPFIDGNGRTARLLMNFLLLARDFPHAIIDVSRRNAHLAAFDEANEGRWEPFALLVALSVEESIRRILPR